MRSKLFRVGARTGGVVAVCAGAFGGGAAMAATDVAFLSQQRSISVLTTADGNAQSASAPDFQPFNRTVSISTTFMGPNGPVTNLAAGRIDCQIDPNAVLASGTLTGQGGVEGGSGEDEVGESKASVFVTFHVNSPIQFRLMAAPRPNVHPSDEFELDLRNLSTHDHLISLEQADPPQWVDMSGVLRPGDYSLKYKVETTFDGGEESRDFSLNLALGCPADFNGADGVTVQDLFDFLGGYFESAAKADFNHSAGVTVQDIFDYLVAYFAGC